MQAMAWTHQLATICLSGLLLAVLSSRSTQGQQQPPPFSEPRCHDNAPDNCSFLCGDTCNWINESGWIATNRSSSNWSVKLGDTSVGRLTSRRACSTGGGSKNHCLMFWYRFQRDFVINLSVLLKQEEETRQGEDTKAVEVWKQFRSPNGPDLWAEANVAINFSTTSSGRGFKVTIQSERFRFDYKQDTVFVDAVRYSRSPCSGGASRSGIATTPATPLQPPEDGDSAESDACARMIMTTPILPTIPKTTTVKMSLSPSSEDTGASSGSVDTVSKKISDQNEEEGGSSSVKAGVIVGVVFSVLAIITIAFLVVIFVFRKHLRS